MEEPEQGNRWGAEGRRAMRRLGANVDRALLLWCAIAVAWHQTSFASGAGNETEQRESLVDRVVASIGKQAITLYEVEKKEEELRAMAAAGLLAEDAQADEQAALQALIDEELLLRVARKMGLEVTDQEVEQTISQMKEQNGWDEQALEENLRRLGFASRKDYERYLRRQMLRNRVIQYKVVSRVRVEQEEVEREFAKRHKEPCPKSLLETHPEGCEPEIHLWHIVFLPAEDANEDEVLELRRRAEEVRKMILEGKLSFEEAARRYSQDSTAQRGGDLGWFTMGFIQPEVEAVAFSLSPGQISDVIVSKLGFHIFRVTERRLVPLKDPEEARARIMYELRERKVRRALESFLKELRARYRVEVHSQLDR